MVAFFYSTTPFINDIKILFKDARKRKDASILLILKEYRNPLDKINVNHNIFLVS